MFPLKKNVLIVVAIVLTLGIGSSVFADQALYEIERTSREDRNALIESGVDLIGEFSSLFLAIGDPDSIENAADELGLQFSLIKAATGNARYAIAGFGLNPQPVELETCGTIILTEREWVLIEVDPSTIEACSQSSSYFFRLLDMAPLKETRPEPLWMKELAESHTPTLKKPMVVDMVTSMTDSFAMSHWQNVVDFATTRYSTAQGCSDAAAGVFAFFDDLGLNPEYQFHTSGHAANVIGTIPGGGIGDDDVIIVIGHLDDLPSSGTAPGADDNASGSAMVMAMAEVMSCYNFTKTIKFIAVTGEEWGLYGSTYYANQASSNSENIIAVLNGDMIGWDGDGQPAIEDLDINYHSSWPSLATLFTQYAADYNTGCVVNAFQCDSMTYSDHSPFWSNGYAAICGITDNHGFCGHSGTYPYYHKSTDTITNCGPGAEAFYGKAVRAFLATAAHLANPISAKAAAPTDLAATASGDNRITLTWTASGSGLNYEILRSPGGCALPGPSLIIGETSLTSFTDTTASGDVDYAYLVRARDSAGGCISSWSSCTEGRTTGTCTEPPVFAGLEHLTNLRGETCSLELSWQPTSRLFCGTEAYYRVYRSKLEGFVPKSEDMVADYLSSTSWIDASNLTSHEPYFYIVRSVDDSNLAEDSNLTEGRGVPTGPVTIGTWFDDGGDTGLMKMHTAAGWTPTGTGGNVGPRVYLTGPYGDNICAALSTGTLHLGNNSQLSFSSHYGIESNWDKGAVQISTDGGALWTVLDINYPDTVTNTGDECSLGTGDFFSGSSSSYQTYSGSLASFAGQDVQLRWVLSSDGSLNDSGWWIDEIEITNVEVPGECTTSIEETLFIDGFESGDTSRW